MQNTIIVQWLGVNILVVEVNSLNAIDMIYHYIHYLTNIHEEKSRVIPKREDELDFECDTIKNKPYDFYYSVKMFALDILRYNDDFKLAYY